MNRYDTEDRTPLEKQLLAVAKTDYSHIPEIAYYPLDTYLLEVSELLGDSRYSSQYYGAILSAMPAQDSQILLTDTVHQMLAKEEESWCRILYLLLIEPFARLQEGEEQ